MPDKTYIYIRLPLENLPGDGHVHLGVVSLWIKMWTAHLIITIRVEDFGLHEWPYDCPGLGVIVHMLSGHVLCLVHRRVLRFGDMCGHLVDQPHQPCIQELTSISLSEITMTSTV